LGPPQRPPTSAHAAAAFAAAAFAAAVAALVPANDLKDVDVGEGVV
jgi:hypothetical protein